MVDRAWHRVAKDLWSARVPAPVSIDVEGAVQRWVEGQHVFWMMLPHPAPVVHKAPGAMTSEFHALEATMWTAFLVGRPGESHAVLRKAQERVEERFEVRLAEQSGPPPCIVQQAGHRGCIGGQGHPVHPDAMVPNVLAREHGGPRRHAHHVLRMGSFVSHPRRCQPVDHWSSGNSAPVAPQSIEALLVGRDKQDAPRHQVLPPLPGALAGSTQDRDFRPPTTRSRRPFRASATAPSKT